MAKYLSLDGLKTLLSILDINTIKSNAENAWNKLKDGLSFSDLSSSVQSSLNKADSAYQKPSKGIPNGDLAGGITYAKLSSSVQTSLGKADSALQSHQSLADYVKTTDSRLSDSRKASDVYSWAKSATKPSYTASEVGARPSTWTPSASDVGVSLSNGTITIGGSTITPITSHQSLSGYAKTKDLEGYVTKTTLEGKGYYTKPSDGIPYTDLAGSIPASKLSTTLQLKLTNMITSSNLASNLEALTSLSLAGVSFDNGVISIGTDDNNKTVISQSGVVVKKLVGSKVYTSTLSQTGVLNTSSVPDSVSDMRAKTVKKDIELTTEQIANAPIFDFVYKDDEDNKLQSGSSAQYWQTVLPNVVKSNDDGLLSLQYAQAALVAVVSLARRVQELEEWVTILSGREFPEESEE